MNSNKILILPSFYPMKENIVPKGTFFREQALLLADKGLDIDILYYEDRNIMDFPFKNIIKNVLKYHFQNAIINDFKINTYVKHSWKLFPLKYEFGQKFWVKSTVSLYKNFYLNYASPSLIHAHYAIWAGEAALEIKRKFKKPYILTEHATHYATGKYDQSHFSRAKLVMQNAEKVIVVSNPLKKLLSIKLELEESKFEVIPNFIDMSFFNTSSLGKENDKFTFLTVCHLDKKKRVDRLITAFYKAFGGKKDIILKIGGVGKERIYLDSLVHKFNLHSQVFFSGALDRDGVKKEMEECDVFVLPSDFETFGVVLIEALALGKPVIGTKSGGPEDIINDKVGLLIEPDLQSLIDALNYMFNNKNRYHANVLREHVNANFSIESVYTKYRKIYDKISS